MTVCEFCDNKVTFADNICPTCYALIPKDECYAAPPRSQNNDGTTFIQIIPPLLVTSILRAYKGPAWIISLLLSVGNITYVHTCLQPKKINKRNFYHVQKLFYSSYANILCETEDDLAFCKAVLQKLSKSLSEVEKSNADFSTILDHAIFKNKIKTYLHFHHDIQNWPALFEMINAQTNTISVHIDMHFKDHHSTFNDVIFRHNIEMLHIENSNISVFHESIWYIQRHLHLINCPHLKTLPEIAKDLSIVEALNIRFIQCALTYLPQTLSQRSIDFLDISYCHNIQALPEILKHVLEKGLIRHVNFQGTHLPLTYQTAFNNKELRLPATLYEKHSIPSQHKIKNITHSHNAHLFIPAGILALLISKMIYPRKKCLLTENIYFWIGLITVTITGNTLHSYYKKAV